MTKWSSPIRTTINSRIPLDFWRNLFQSSKKNSFKRQIEFALGWEDFHSMVEQSMDRCVISGRFFEVGRTKGFHRNPWAPSLDRIDNSMSYSKENCRIICLIVNLAMNEWGESILYELSFGMVNTKPKSIELALMEHARKLNHGAKLSELDAEQIRRSYQTGRISMKILAGRYRVSESAIRKIIGGRTYRSFVPHVVPKKLSGVPCGI